MDFEALQRMWQEQDGAAHAGRPAVDDALVRIRRFERRLLFGDLAEIAAALVPAGAFCLVGLRTAVGWPWLAAAVVVLAVGGVFAFDVLRRRLRSPVDSVAAGLHRAIGDVEHRMRRLSTIAWWYFAPLTVAVGLVGLGGVLGLRSRLPAAEWAAVRPVAWLALALALALLVVVNRSSWRRNLAVVEHQLRPERDALAAVLAELEGDEAPAGD